MPPELDSAAALLKEADAYVISTPEMNHTISPALTNMMNYFGSSTYSYRPSGIATYSAGNWGGARCGVALRAFLGELGCLPVSATAQVSDAARTLCVTAPSRAAHPVLKCVLPRPREVFGFVAPSMCA